MPAWVRRFAGDESGEVVEKLGVILVMALGGTAVLFGILAALRAKGGEIAESIRSM